MIVFASPRLARLHSRQARSLSVVDEAASTGTAVGVQCRSQQRGQATIACKRAAC